MRKIYQILSLAPAPLFFLGFIYSTYHVFTAPIMCHTGHTHHTWHQWEMPIMWLVMCLAHVTPWLLWLQQRDLARD
jgi:hypothetical protein